MNTTENNKKLAEFIEANKGIKTLFYLPQFGQYQNSYGQIDYVEVFREEELKFHNDYNWLMKVAEKIETVETKDGKTFTIDMHKDNVIINQYGKYNNEIIVTEGGTRIENLYRACIEFVEWWKQEQEEVYLAGEK